MAVVTTQPQGELDRILTIEGNHAKSEALKQFFEANDTVVLRATAPLKFSYRRKEYSINAKKGVEISARLAVMLLELHGRHGVYFGRHAATGITEDTWAWMPESERLKYERYAPIVFQNAYLYHFEPDVEPVAGEAESASE